MSKCFDDVLKHLNIFSEQTIYKVICPFHGDKNPSLQINRDKDFFYCYGCQASGTTIDLLKLSYPNKNIFELYKTLKKITNASIYNNIYNIYNIYNNTVKSSVENSRKEAKDYFYNLPETNWIKVSEDIVEIKHYMNKRGLSSITLNKQNAKATYNSNYPIVFPLFDNKIFKGYVMRTMDPTVEANRKYMYNRGFRRSNTLAGKYTSDSLIIVEGYLDKISLNQMGFEDVVAILGWKISDQQFKKIKRARIKTIICALDNDESGNKGYRYLKRLCLNSGINIKRLRYPKGIKDCCDALKDQKTKNKIITQIKFLFTND